MSDAQKIISDGVTELSKVHINKHRGISLFDDDGRKKGQATLLIEIGSQGLLFHDSSGDAYSEVERDGIKITMKIRSKEFVEYLSHSLYVLADKGANATAITDAKNTLEAKAKYSGMSVICAVRAYSSGNIFIDLGCDLRRVIEVSDKQWCFNSNAPVKFVRKKGMQALPDPTSNGDLHLLRKYLNINASDYYLITGWMFCALGAVKPYPILIFQGEQGTGKSTNTRVIRSLIDPSSVPLRTPPKDTQNLLVSAGNTHIVAIDNLSGLKAEISDCLCRLSTGGGIDMRALFTDDEQHLVDIQKPVIVNGIDDVASRHDLAERSIIINLPVIPDCNRRTEKEYWDSFEVDKPRILAGLLDGLVSGLKNINSIALPEKPRMADVAQWVTACERDLGIEGEFLKAHRQNQLSAIESNIEASPVGAAINELMSTKSRWSGTPTQLFNELENISSDRVVRSRAWPQSTKGLHNIIKRLTPSFRKTGIEITKKETHGREYILETVGNYPSQPPQTHKNVRKAFNSCADSAHCADKSQAILKDSKFKDVI